MIITHQIKMDLKNRGITPRIDGVQGDSNTRAVELSLYANNTLWKIPEGVSARVRYRKSDGTGGIYDTLPDGTVAWKIADNVVTVTLAPQMLSVAGCVTFQVELLREELCLATFSVQLFVEQDPSADVLASENYVNLRQWLQAELLDSIPSWAREPQKPAYTPEEVGAAPAGYGLGENAPYIMDANKATANGWYGIVPSTMNVPFPTLGVLRADVSSSGMVVQEATFSNGERMRRIKDMTWGEWTPAIPAWANAQHKPSYTPEEVGASPEGHVHAQYLTANQGADNAGKMLVVGADGNLVLTDIPAALSGDVVGTIDEDNNIVITGALAEGTYTFRYENTDGTYAPIGTLTIAAGAGYTNVLPTAVDLDGSVFNGVGYMGDARLSTSSATHYKSNTGTDLTGLIPIAAGDKIRFKNCQLTTGAANHTITFYTANKEFATDGADIMSIVPDSIPAVFPGSKLDGNNNVVELDLNIVDTSTWDTSLWAYVRFCGVFDETSVITVNEEITE